MTLGYLVSKAHMLGRRRIAGTLKSVWLCCQLDIARSSVATSRVLLLPATPPRLRGGIALRRWGRQYGIEASGDKDELIARLVRHRNSLDSSRLLTDGSVRLSTIRLQKNLVLIRSPEMLTLTREVSGMDSKARGVARTLLNYFYCSTRCI